MVVAESRELDVIPFLIWRADQPLYIHVWTQYLPTPFTWRPKDLVLNLVKMRRSIVSFTDLP